MSDLIFVCVSADMDLAEALADVFEAAGHVIGDNESEARATIVIWSHAARRSPAFIETAQRATDAGKAIVVTREGLAADTVEGAPVFDLTGWDGDADASLIDPLFNAVDRKLMLDRADHAVDQMNVEPVDAPSAEPAFAPPRVRTDFGAWKRHGFGDAARVVALVAVLLGGAMGAGAFLSQRDAPAPAARAPIASEIAYTQAATETATHAAFTDVVSNDASLDDAVPPEPVSLGVRRGREPPSASSLPRRERSARWRDAAYQPSEAAVHAAAYQAPD